jgi:hypothetical protein
MARAAAFPQIRSLRERRRPGASDTPTAARGVATRCCLRNECPHTYTLCFERVFDAQTRNSLGPAPSRDPYRTVPRATPIPFEAADVRRAGPNDEWHACCLRHQRREPSDWSVRVGGDRPLLHHVLADGLHAFHLLCGSRIGGPFHPEKSALQFGAHVSCR